VTGTLQFYDSRPVRQNIGEKVSAANPIIALTVPICVLAAPSEQPCGAFGYRLVGMSESDRKNGAPRTPLPQHKSGFWSDQKNFGVM